MVGRYADICHANMRYHSGKLYDQLITGVPRDNPLDLAYITFLIEGPFRSFQDRISLETIEIEGVHKFYLRCTKLDTWPANVIYNFCIATRVPVEFSAILPLWGKMVEAGVNQSLAFLVASRVYKRGEKTLDPADFSPDPWEWKLDSLYCPNSGHFWFDPTSGWEPILLGEPLINAFTANYKANPAGCTPCNSIWGKVKPTDRDRLSHKTVKQLSDHFGFTKSDNPCAEVKISVDEFVPAHDDFFDDIIVDDFDDDDDDDDFDDDDDEIFDVDDDDDI